MLTRVHIIGAPRSGTTLLLELMATAFRFDCVFKNERAVLKPLLAADGLCLSKRPVDYYASPALLERDPGQWFVYMLRDPRDVIVSIHAKAPDRYWANLGQWLRSWDVVRVLLGHPRLLLLRYEELVRDPQRAQRRVEAWLPQLERVASFEDFSRRVTPSPDSLQALRSVRPIDRESIGLWRRHRPRVAAQLERYGTLCELLAATEYETDAGWLDEIRGIEPDRRPGFWPDCDLDFLAAQQSQWLAAELPPYLRWRGLAS